MYLLLNVVLGIVIFGGVAAGLISSLVGRWDLWNVWAYAAIGAFWSSVLALVTYRISPDLLKERLKPANPGRVQWTVGLTFLILSFVQWVIAGLDLRFHWLDIVPPAGVVAGLVFYAVGWGLFTWASAVNPFFSPVVRMQADRGQRVISAGLYAIVRHPGYASNVLFVAASAAALNSLLSLIPAVIFTVITVRVTAIEDRMLRDELLGYADYAAKVRFRLLPGVW